LKKCLVEALRWAEIKTNTLAWVANVELGGLGERRGAGDGELAFLEVWPGLEKKISELAIDR
jgi:hypothetical protein